MTKEQILQEHKEFFNDFTYCGEKRRSLKYDLSNADLSNANLTGASFLGNNLANADLSNAIFMNNEVGTESTSVNLSRVNLRGARLLRTYFSDVENIEDVIVDEHTKFLDTPDNCTAEDPKRIHAFLC